VLLFAMISITLGRLLSRVHGIEWTVANDETPLPPLTAEQRH
jgi:hypothetical protein